MPNVVRIPVAAGAFDPTDITLTDDTSGALLIKEGSNEYMRINTTNSAEQTIFANGSSNEYMKIDTTSGQPGVTIKMPAGVPLRFQADQYQGLNASGSVYRAFSIGSANNWAFGDMTSASPGYLRGYANDIRIIHSATGGSNSGVQMRARGAGTGDTFKIQSDTVTNFEVDQDSNATFTLDDTSGAVFKVVDDGSSPYTYLSATEGENCVRMNALRTDSTGALRFQNNTGAPFFEFYQNGYIQQYVKPRDSKTRTGLTGSGASQSTTIDLRLGSVRGVQHLQINHGYSGTQTVTLNLNNTLSAFAGNQDWGVNSLLVLVENLTTGQDVTFQIRETTGGTTTFIDHTGASLSDPTGSGSLTLKNVGAASGKNFITFRVSQFNNNHGSASLYDDDRYIVEALTAELY
jgi:hypothetical protein